MIIKLYIDLNKFFFWEKLFHNMTWGTAVRQRLLLNVTISRFLIFLLGLQVLLKKNVHVFNKYNSKWLTLEYFH